MRYHQTGTKRLHHPVVGELELSYEVLDLAADDGVTMAAYSAEPGSRSQEALDLLASWTATATPAAQSLGESRDTQHLARRRETARLHPHARTQDDDSCNRPRLDRPRMRETASHAKYRPEKGVLSLVR